MQVASHVYRFHIAEDPNISPMHPGGTNIYFVGDPSEEMLVIDAGEHYRDWTRRILEFHRELGSPTISALLISHGHGDHIGGADRLQEAMRCPVRCHPKLSETLGRILGREAVVPLRSKEAVPTGGGVNLRALFTPGHADDHVCYYLPGERIMFTGDTILGGSSTTVRSLHEYINSLELLARYRPRIICPGHGPVMTDGTRRVEGYIRHRLQREQDVIEALGKGHTSLADIMSCVYPPNLRRGLWPAAERNVLTHLAKLKEEGRVVETASSYTLGSISIVP